MEKLRVEQLSFRYALGRENALEGIGFSLLQGETLLLCGSSGSGKSTLLKLLKKETAPRGTFAGKIIVDGRERDLLTPRESAARIGYVGQNPETGAVTDNVLSELAFGMENLGTEPKEMQRRIAWISAYFGIEDLLSRKTEELSGGELQLVSLAAAVAMQPDLLLLDEPVSCLDPQATERFLDAVFSVNRDFGTAVIFADHRVEAYAGRVSKILMLEKGRQAEWGPFRETAERIAGGSSEIAGAFRAALTPKDLFYRRLFAKNDGRNAADRGTGRELLSLRNVCFRYEKNGRDVIRGVDFSLCSGEIVAMLGSNGAGKTTLLDLMAGVRKPTRGKIMRKGRCVKTAQNPIFMFSGETVEEDFRTLLSLRGEKEPDRRLEEVTRLTASEALLSVHPLDLSGGELERCALAKLLLSAGNNPDTVLLLDEPTKGLDFRSKENLAEVLRGIAGEGRAVLLVTHDEAFAEAVSHRVCVLSGGLTVE